MNEDNRNLFPKYIMYGHSYVPNQTMKNIFNPETALKLGSLYPELVSPYNPGQSVRVIEELKRPGGAIYGD